MGGYLEAGVLDVTTNADRLNGGIDMEAIRQEFTAGRRAAEETDMDPITYREVVVRRLLERGVRASTLATLLPDWRELIGAVAATVEQE